MRVVIIIYSDMFLHDLRTMEGFYRQVYGLTEARLGAPRNDGKPAGVVGKA